MSIFHSQINYSNVHVPYSFLYATETAMLAATNFQTTDIGKLARVENNNSLWLLISVAPVLWRPLTSEYQ